jgi:hypothetical protein
MTSVTLGLENKHSVNNHTFKFFEEEQTRKKLPSNNIAVLSQKTAILLDGNKIYGFQSVILDPINKFYVIEVKVDHLPRKEDLHKGIVSHTYTYYCNTDGSVRSKQGDYCTLSDK